MIFSGQNMKSKAVSSCQQNIKILYQGLFALCPKALCVQVPLTQISMNNHLTYIHSHLCEWVQLWVCLFVFTQTLYRDPVLRTFATVKENFHLAKLCMKGKVCSIIIIIFMFFSNEETENERSLLKLILFFLIWESSSNENWTTRATWWLDILEQMAMALCLALPYVQWRVWNRCVIGKQGNAPHILPNVCFC